MEPNPSAKAAHLRQLTGTHPGEFCKSPKKDPQTLRGQPDSVEIMHQLHHYT